MQTKKCDIPPKFPIYETAKGPGILAGPHWGTSVVFIDSKNCKMRLDVLDPELVSLIHSENKGWGFPELLREMQKYPGTSGPASNKAECGSEPETVVVGGVRSGKTDDKMFMQV